jgi:hypothetical protein
MSAEASYVTVLPLQKGSIRIRPDGWVNVLDIQQLADNDRAWAKFLAQHNGAEVTAQIANQLDIPIKDMIQSEYEPERMIWVQFDLALVFAATVNPSLYADMAITYRRVKMGDVTVAATIIEQQTDSTALGWLLEYIETQIYTKLWKGSIHDHGGHTWIYGTCENTFYKSVSGKDSKELKSKTGVTNARHALSEGHLALHRFLQTQHVRRMDETDSNGNEDIKHEAVVVASKGEKIAVDFDLHNENLIRDYFKDLKKLTRSLRKKLPQTQVRQAGQQTQTDKYPPLDDPWWDTCAPSPYIQ